jgi:hypothetical protein
MKHLFLFILLNLSLSLAYAQTEEQLIKSMFDEALTDPTAFENLRILCKKYSGRITGSPEAAGAVEFTYKVMSEMNLDSVF